MSDLKNARVWEGLAVGYFFSNFPGFDNVSKPWVPQKSYDRHRKPLAEWLKRLSPCPSRRLQLLESSGAVAALSGASVTKGKGWGPAPFPGEKHKKPQLLLLPRECATTPPR